MIKFEVNRQIVKITHCDTVVADSIDYIEAEVVFSSEDWQSMDRIYLHFCDGENDYPIDVTDGKIEKSNHLCLTAGRWDVWAHGNRFDNGTVAERITTNVIGIKVKPSGAIEGQIMPMPASIAEQLDARVTYLEEHGGGGGTVDQHYNENSTNAQSGKAVAEAIAPINEQVFYDSSKPNTLAGKVIMATTAANMAMDMMGEVPEDTDVQSEIDSLDTRVTALEHGGGGGDTTRLDNIVAILRQLVKSAVYVEDVSATMADLDSYFEDSGVTKIGDKLIIVSGVTATQNDDVLSIR